MESTTKYPAPNVVAGTNFNTQRFRELFAWISGMTADAARAILEPHQYGLLVAYDGKPSLQLEKTEDLLFLHRCAAISPGGRVIGIFEDTNSGQETDLKDFEMDPQVSYHVMVEVDGSERDSFGPKTGDLPERPQYSMPSYRLHVQPVTQETGLWSDAIPIGLLQFDGREWQLVDFIPPCAHIGASDQLRNKYRDYNEAMKVILNAQPSIIRQTASFRDKSMLELREFCMQCGSFLAARQNAMNALTNTGQPFQLLETWTAFANTMGFLLECLSDRPGFYNLLYQNTKSVNGVMLTTERLDQAIFMLTNHEYQHEAIAETIKAIDTFLTLIVPMFKALGNGTLRPTGNSYEGVAQTPKVVESRQSYTTW